MSVIKKICSAILLISLFALAGCPEMAQQSGSSSDQPAERGGGMGD